MGGVFLQKKPVSEIPEPRYVERCRCLTALNSPPTSVDLACIPLLVVFEFAPNTHWAPSYIFVASGSRFMDDDSPPPIMIWSDGPDRGSQGKGIVRIFNVRKDYIA